MSVKIQSSVSHGEAQAIHFYLPNLVRVKNRLSGRVNECPELYRVSAFCRAGQWTRRAGPHRYPPLRSKQPSTVGSLARPEGHGDRPGTKRPGRQGSMPGSGQFFTLGFSPMDPDGRLFISENDTHLCVEITRVIALKWRDAQPTKDQNDPVVKKLLKSQLNARPEALFWTSHVWGFSSVRRGSGVWSRGPFGTPGFPRLWVWPPRSTSSLSF